MKNKILYLLLFPLTLLSCTFSTEKENLLDLDQSTVPPDIDNLTLDFDSDTLYVWKTTKFNFDLVSSDQEIWGVEIHYGEKEFLFHSASGSFEINPQNFPEGKYVLEMKVFTHSGTGSLADYMGREVYGFQREWVLFVEKPVAPEIKISSIIENGFLKFSWDKMQKPYFKSYNLFIENVGLAYSYSFEYTDYNKNIFIDSLFVGGNIKASLYTWFYDVNGSETYVYTEYLYKYPISVNFNEDLEDLTISWDKNPFQCETYLAIQNSEPVQIKSDSMYTVSAPGLGNTQKYHLGFKPLKKLMYDWQMYDIYQLYTKGINHTYKCENIVYNTTLKNYYLKYPMHITSLDENFGLTGSFGYSWDYYDKHSIDFSADNQSLYSTVHQKIVQLSSSGLNQLKTLPLDLGESESLRIRLLKNIDETVFLVGYDSYFVLYDSGGNKLIDKTTSLKGYGLKSENSFSVSENGKYVAFANENGLLVFENLNNQKLVLRFEDSDKYYSCFFDPFSADKLILNGGDGIRFFSCSKLQTEKVLTQFYANPINIDPVSHFMLLVSNSQKKIFVYDYENDKLILEMNHHGFAFDFSLLNNNIITKQGFHFNISEYVD